MDKISESIISIFLECLRNKADSTEGSFKLPNGEKVSFTITFSRGDENG